MIIQATYAAAAIVGALALGFSSANANPLSRGGSTVSMNGDSGSSSSREEAQGVLGSIFDSVFSVRFGRDTVATAAGGAAGESDPHHQCDKDKEAAAGASDEHKKDEKEPVGPEPIYFGF